jgi:hypothetical protein
MVHLKALPGSPGFEGSIDSVVAEAVADAVLLNNSGFPSLMIENFGDVPFYADDVPASTVAGITHVVDAVSSATDAVVGVNVLRNDALSALAVASATGASFIRVNVLTGLMYTDQGPITGRAAEVARARKTLAPDVEVWADVLVKHATPPPGLNATQAAEDTVERGMADAVIVSGSGTGSMPDLSIARQIRSGVGSDTTIAVGSGANADNLGNLLEVANAVIVGSSMKEDGDPTKPLDQSRIDNFVEAALRHGLI